MDSIKILDFTIDPPNKYKVRDLFNYYQYHNILIERIMVYREDDDVIVRIYYQGPLVYGSPELAKNIEAYLSRYHKIMYAEPLRWVSINRGGSNDNYHVHELIYGYW